MTGNPCCVLTGFLSFLKETISLYKCTFSSETDHLGAFKCVGTYSFTVTWTASHHCWQRFYISVVKNSVMSSLRVSINDEWPRCDQRRPAWCCNMRWCEGCDGNAADKSPAKCNILASVFNLLMYGWPQKIPKQSPFKDVHEAWQEGLLLHCRLGPGQIQKLDMSKVKSC